MLPVPAFDQIGVKMAGDEGELQTRAATQEEKDKYIALKQTRRGDRATLTRKVEAAITLSKKDNPVDDDINLAEGTLPVLEKMARELDELDKKIKVLEPFVDSTVLARSADNAADYQIKSGMAQSALRKMTSTTQKRCCPCWRK